MSNKNMLYQFMYSAEKKPVNLMGTCTQSGSVGAFATLVNNGITWTAVTMGAAGNSITVALVAGGTAGAEVVTVTGNAISVSIESTVSTRTQVLTAVQASSAASALVGISVASGGTAASLLAATPLASGVSTSFTQSGKYFDFAQIGTGLYQITTGTQYAALLAQSITIQKASATDVKAQVYSVDVATGIIKFRVITVATPANLASGDVVYIDLKFRNSTKW